MARWGALSGNRGTPDMALRGAVDSEDIIAFEGQLVRVEVGAQDYRITPATREEAEAQWAESADRPAFSPVLNDERTELLDQCALGFGDVAVAGAKAAQMGVLINIQTSGASVTSARGDQIPEQWLVFTYLPAREPELLARSTLSPEAPILRREEVLELTRQLEAIHAVWEPRMAEDGSNAVDVEMLLAGEDRHFVLVQARPYTVVWQGREEVHG